MWRTQTDHHMGRLQPGQILGGGLVASATRHQATHAVTDQHQFPHRLRPDGNEVGQQSRQLAAVVRNRQAGVIAQVERGVAQIGLQPRAVGEAWRILSGSGGGFPALLVAAKAVDENNQAVAGIGQMGAQTGGGEWDGMMTGGVETHDNGEWVGTAGQMIAHGGVERAAQTDGQPAGRRSLGGRAGGGALFEQGGGFEQPTTALADGGVNPIGNRVVRVFHQPRRPSQARYPLLRLKRQVGNRAVHLLDAPSRFLKADLQRGIITGDGRGSSSGIGRV